MEVGLALARRLSDQFFRSTMVSTAPYFWKKWNAAMIPMGRRARSQLWR